MAGEGMRGGKSAVAKKRRGKKKGGFLMPPFLFFSRFRA